MVPAAAQGACGGLGDGIEVLLSAFDSVGIDAAVLLPGGIDRSDLQSDVRRLRASTAPPNEMVSSDFRFHRLPTCFAFGIVAFWDPGPVWIGEALQLPDGSIRGEFLHFVLSSWDQEEP